MSAGAMMSLLALVSTVDALLLRMNETAGLNVTLGVAMADIYVYEYWCCWRKSHNQAPAMPAGDWDHLEKYQYAAAPLRNSGIDAGGATWTATVAVAKKDKSEFMGLVMYTFNDDLTLRDGGACTGGAWFNSVIAEDYDMTKYYVIGRANIAPPGEGLPPHVADVTVPADDMVEDWGY